MYFFVFHLQVWKWLTIYMKFRGYVWAGVHLSVWYLSYAKFTWGSGNLRYHGILRSLTQKIHHKYSGTSTDPLEREDNIVLTMNPKRKSQIQTVRIGGVSLWPRCYTQGTSSTTFHIEKQQNFTYLTIRLYWTTQNGPVNSFF